MKTQSQVVLLLLGATQGRLSAGKCATVPAFQNVDAEKLQGIWYPVYIDKQDLQKFDASCFKTKTSLAKNWWKMQWSNEDSSSDGDDAGGEEKPKDDKEKDKKEGEGDAGGEEKPKDENKDKDKKEGEGEAGGEEKPKDEKPKDENAKDSDDAADIDNSEYAKISGDIEDKLPEGTARFINSAYQINENGSVNGFLWTVDMLTKGDATAEAFFMGQSIGKAIIVDTDYESYIITHSCNPVEGQDNVKKEEWGLCLRDQNLSAEEVQKIWDKANEHLQKVNSGAGGDVGAGEDGKKDDVKEGDVKEGDVKDAGAGDDAKKEDDKKPDDKKEDDKKPDDANADGKDAGAEGADKKPDDKKPDDKKPDANGDVKDAGAEGADMAREQYDFKLDWAPVKQGDENCKYYEW